MTLHRMLPQSPTASLLLAAALALALPHAASAQAAAAATASTTDAQALADRLLAHLDAGRFADAEAMFSAQMRAAVPAAALEQLWRSLPAQAGARIGRGGGSVRSANGATLVAIPLDHATVDLMATVAIDGEGRISGFHVGPAPAAPAPAEPVPAGAGFSERALPVGSGERALGGTLAIPDGDGPFPGVVLVHGSGPHDRDETIGPNRPFLDIARGLAARGIAVLRYDKRSKARPQDLAGDALTVDAETTDDAVAAVAALRAVPGIDPARVFVLGHSQGGLMAPRIATRSGDVAGLVLLAAPARPLLDILLEQNRRLAVLDDGRTSDAERAAIDGLVAQVKSVRDPASDPAARGVMNLPNLYWRSIDGVDAVAEARKAARPMLVLQGGRDIQVVDADWQQWRAAFHADPKVSFKLYPSLNHLGMAGEGEGSLAEYMRPGKVDPTLVADIATWVLAR